MADPVAHIPRVRKGGKAYIELVHDGEPVLLTYHQSGKATAEELLGKQFLIIKKEDKVTIKDPESGAIYSSPTGVCKANLKHHGGVTNEWQGPAHVLVKREGYWISLKNLMKNH